MSLAWHGPLVDSTHGLMASWDLTISQMWSLSCWSNTTFMAKFIHVSLWIEPWP
jgi:hypothetical protein